MADEFKGIPPFGKPVVEVIDTPIQRISKLMKKLRPQTDVRHGYLLRYILFGSGRISWINKPISPTDRKLMFRNMFSQVAFEDIEETWIVALSALNDIHSVNWTYISPKLRVICGFLLNAAIIDINLSLGRLATAGGILKHSFGQVSTADADSAFDAYLKDKRNNSGKEASENRIKDADDLNMETSEELEHIIQDELYALAPRYTGTPLYDRTTVQLLGKHLNTPLKVRMRCGEKLEEISKEVQKSLRGINDVLKFASFDHSDVLFSYPRLPEGKSFDFLETISWVLHFTQPGRKGDKDAFDKLVKLISLDTLREVVLGQLYQDSYLYKFLKEGVVEDMKGTRILYWIAPPEIKNKPLWVRKQNFNELEGYRTPNDRVLIFLRQYYPKDR